MISHGLGVFFRKMFVTKKSNDDKGDLVQTIIIIAGFAVAAIVVIGGISSVLMEKGERTARCISNFSPTNVFSAKFDNDCKSYTWEVLRDNPSLRTYRIQFDEAEEFNEYRNDVISDCIAINKGIDYSISTNKALLAYDCNIFSDGTIDSGDTPGTPENFPFLTPSQPVLW